jgi:hypothetical protein
MAGKFLLADPQAELEALHIALHLCNLYLAG